LKNKLKHVGFGMINLSSGKMSSRTGNIIDGVSLIENIGKEIQHSYNVEEDLAKRIGISAIKYGFLKSEILKNILFDMDKSIAKEGDSGPYLLYTYVRTLGILKDKQSNSLDE